MKTNLYILASIVTFTAWAQASVTEKLAASKNEIESIKSNIDSDNYLAQTKCKNCSSRCHNACGAR